uniref:Uncharacterized protein n=1 Tax=Romanomermis culicivorax TaxID=13658 RepID=A0A915KRY0_ROMCU
MMLLEGHRGLRIFLNQGLVKALTNDGWWTTSVKESWSFLGVNQRYRLLVRGVNDQTPAGVNFAKNANLRGPLGG